MNIRSTIVIGSIAVLLCRASWYSPEDSSNLTANGEVFTGREMTCAMRSHEFGRKYRVTNRANHAFVTVRHNDFGPAMRRVRNGVCIDLSRAAFMRLAPLEKGVIDVEVEEVR